MHITDTAWGDWEVVRPNCLQANMSQIAQVAKNMCVAEFYSFRVFRVSRGSFRIPHSRMSIEPLMPAPAKLITERRRIAQ
jgi:hypothetical protein